MKCPECGLHDLKIVNSRHREGVVWRRRKCSGCKYVFTTIEVIHELKPGRPKLDGDRLVHR